MYLRKMYRAVPTLELWENERGSSPSLRDKTAAQPHSPPGLCRTASGSSFRKWGRLTVSAQGGRAAPGPEEEAQAVPGLG